MRYTNSRVFCVEDETTLKVSAVKSPGGDIFAPIDHPCIFGFEKLTPEGKLAANTEYLKAIGQNFWDKLPILETENTALETVQIRSDFTTIPSHDWISLIKLYSSFCSKTSHSELEVGGLIICHRETKQLRIVIPKQKVTKSSVDWRVDPQDQVMKFLDGTDLSSEDYTNNWDLMGITHSHNTMFTSPSSTDDKYEVGTKKNPLPTGVHILLGSFSNYKDWENTVPTFQVFPSVSHMGTRFDVDSISEFVDTNFTEQQYQDTSFDSSILDLIEVPAARYIPQAPLSHRYTKISTVPEIQQQRQQLYDLQKDIKAVIDLGKNSEGRKFSTSQYLLTQAIELLNQLTGFLYDELGEDPLDIIQTVEENMQFYTGDIDDDLMDKITDPFFVGD